MVNWASLGNRYGQPTGGTSLVGGYTPPPAVPGQMRAFGGEVGMEQILGAMGTTQKRAMEDRAARIAALRLAGQQGLAALQPFQASIQQLQAQPEAIGAKEESQIYEAGRTPIEAGAQAQLRQIQEGFFPGGFARGAATGVQEAGTGQLGQLASRTSLERVLRRRQDMLALMGQQAQYGQLAGGVQERMGRGLSDIYSQTIAAVPQIAQPGQPGGPQLTKAPKGLSGAEGNEWRRLQAAGQSTAQLADLARRRLQWRRGGGGLRNKPELYG